MNFPIPFIFFIFLMVEFRFRIVRKVQTSSYVKIIYLEWLLKEIVIVLLILCFELPDGVGQLFLLCFYLEGETL